MNQVKVTEVGHTTSKDHRSATMTVKIEMPLDFAGQVALNFQPGTLGTRFSETKFGKVERT